MVPLGNGTIDFGCIAGIVGADTEIRHCYFAGEMDLSQYTATTPYKRLGGIAGGVSSDTPVFENNYFVETENVSACFKYKNAGTAETLDFMKTEDFFNEITAAGGNYRFNSNGTPLLPAPKYTVSFVVTPAELANVVIKVNGQEVANPVDLEAGTYAVEVNADNCEVFNSNITITADTATHTQTITMTYRSSGGDDSDPTYAIEVGEDIRNGTVTANRRYAERDDTVTITVTPDKGYTLETLTVTDKNGKDVALTKKSDTEYTFVMPAGKVEITPSFFKQAEEPSRVFVDVKTGDYFYDAVQWAVGKGITNGTSAETFSPEDPCTRAQIVTFLWRAAGSPVVNYAMDLSDVAGDAYYAEAVRWALSEGITTGTSADQFSPDATCTREQAVTFLYRAAGSPAVSGESAFEDVGADAYYDRAVAWAAQNGVTNGISQALFGTGSDCTRAQIVTFLYRAQQGK